ncbi:UDP-glucose--hexose-1-phosphate uridylyltransferase [Vagococcus silagei]|uniref:Galactose-1-phosphate uridylyltransferase n=1 Tax=Vagococcus silagei TaxID=2508885 RepID=A0A4S3B111_9ENTE|nr:UDP-glucose--hexose-1-phosphate uridylyltransferase [Vagococcus silagei]THB60711.1 UDP-glucose--hexose-1-phosphate uridylyltransferase [Vagococcus silagei]
MSISQTIYDFTSFALKYGEWMEMDRLYLQNRLLALIGEDSLDVVTATENWENLDVLDLLDALTSVALENEVIADSFSEKEQLEAKIMDFLTPPPSVLNALFAQRYDDDPVTATDYFYELSRKNNYIKTRAIAKNKVFTVDTEYGALDITINLSKPEKDPKQIALEKSTKKSNYPACMLCMENEGHAGRANHPARTNHRIIRMNLNTESWGLQYSPYAYYNEHCIFLAEEHRPMVIQREAFDRLLSIVDIFPHYFVGSNADLPIVGGSILSHDHYQGGRYDFAMAKAPIETTFDLPIFPNVNAGIVKWPMSVIRLSGKKKEDLVNAADYILASWKNFSLPELEIVAVSEGGTPHHTVTPIARKNNGLFELDLVLRDNNVSEQHPDGIFHPHQKLHHIKKENIGLIEVMGLAILPPRLISEMNEVKNFLLDLSTDVAHYHLDWAKEIKATHDIQPDTVDQLLEQEIGLVFKEVLENAGVFKRDEQGKQAFLSFVEGL